MNFEQAQKIAQTLLYEGYNLYPYRPDSLKNRQRWPLGGLFPQSFVGPLGSLSSDRWFNQTQCLLRADELTKLRIRVCFLHLIDRSVYQHGDIDDIGGDQWKKVATLQGDGQTFYSWEEACEREITLPSINILDLSRQGPQTFSFEFGEETHQESLLNHSGRIIGTLVRHQERLKGLLELEVEQRKNSLYRLTVQVKNLTPSSGSQMAHRQSFASVHGLFALEGGEFFSAFDPPADLQEEAAACQNLGTWPVLVGSKGERNLFLSSPIILYDYPEVALQSPGDFFDALEIDEILALRIQTLTDEEKQVMKSLDERTRFLLERVENLHPQKLQSLHGCLRPGNSALDINVKVGQRVQLFPQGSDIFDTVLEGMVATIISIEQDFEDQIHLSVTIDDDPGKDLGALGMPGHRFFFKPSEVRPL